MGKKGNNICKPPSSDQCDRYGLREIRNKGVSDYAYISRLDPILDDHYGGGILEEAWVKILIYASTGSQLVRQRLRLVQLWQWRRWTGLLLLGRRGRALPETSRRRRRRRQPPRVLDLYGHTNTPDISWSRWWPLIQRQCGCGCGRYMRPNNRHQPPLCGKQNGEEEIARKSYSAVGPKEEEERVGKYYRPSAPLPQMGQHRLIKLHDM